VSRLVRSLRLRFLLPVVIAPTIACGALFGVDFYESVPSDSGSIADASHPHDAMAADVTPKHFCQGAEHAICLDFDEDVIVPDGWAAMTKFGSVALTTDARISPPASLVSRIYADAASPFATQSSAFLSSPALLDFVRSLTYEVDVRIVSCEPTTEAFPFLEVFTDVISQTALGYDPQAKVLVLYYQSPFRDGGGNPLPGGGSNAIIILGAQPAEWAHVRVQITFPAQGSSQFTATVGTIYDGGGGVTTLETVSDAGLIETTDGGLLVGLGLQESTYSPCEVELDNFTLDYTTDE
jgi:hypothetical protein